MRTTVSRRLMRRARPLMPGGVNSPVRAFGAVGGHARFIARANGASIEDVDGNRYVDFVASWGAILLGHAHPVVVDAVRRAAGLGTSFGAPTEAELEMAERICDRIPSVERLRLVSSGTEATMSAIRLARGATARERIVKFEGCYHGHSDALLAAAGSGVATLGIPDSAGVPRGAVSDTIVLPYNDLDAVERAFAERGEEIAAILVEPIAANMGLVLPQGGFLEGLRSIADTYGSVLIFDEVITGFRVAAGGAQAWAGVPPDLTCFGKVIGGGLPIGAYGGSARLMSLVAPDGPVYQAGTLSGNPLSTAAGLAVLDLISEAGFYERLEHFSVELSEGLRGLAKEAGAPFCMEARGGLAGFFFHPGPVENFRDAQAADASAFQSFFQSMLERGIYLPPSPFEAVFITAAHGPDELERTLTAARRALKKL